MPLFSAPLGDEERGRFALAPHVDHNHRLVPQKRYQALLYLTEYAAKFMQHDVQYISSRYGINFVENYVSSSTAVVQNCALRF